MLFLTFLSITNWPMALFRVAGCPCACGDSLFLLSTSTKAQSSGQNGHDHDRLYKFQSISPPFVASCTARVRSHGQQRFCQVLWMYGRRCCLNRKFQIPSSNGRIRGDGAPPRRFQPRRDEGVAVPIDFDSIVCVIGGLKSRFNHNRRALAYQFE